MDEETAGIDFKTNDLIQTTIWYENLEILTALTIALY